MTRTDGAGSGRGRGFTLIELLVVMGIITILVSLLLPAINQAMVAVRTAATQHTIQGLETGLEGFKQEFGIYPPANQNHDNGYMKCGQSALVYYLMGPNYTGWGSNYGNQGPFSGSTNVMKTYNPFFTPDHPGDLNSVDQSGGAAGLPCLWDSFSPGKAIMYFRFEPTDTNPYDVTTCPDMVSGNINTSKPYCASSFYSQAQFENLVHPIVSGSGGTAVRKWVREDYILISPGQDRYYGPINIDVNGNVTPYDPAAFGSVATLDYLCDDVCNFHK